MAKRLLYLEDLYDFYSNTYKRSTHFNADKSGNPIVVHVRGKVNFENSDKDTEGLLPVHLQACHTNLNVNGSNIADDVMTSALPSFSNRPILGYIHKVDDQWEFYTHNMHENEDGEIVYDEHPIGIIPESCNAQLVYDKEKDRTYCEVDGYIFEEYSKAAEILQREEECSVSVELSIRSLSYNAKEKYLNIEDFFFSGVTILGKTPEGKKVNPGMENSNIKLADFSVKNNSLFNDYESKLIEMQKRLDKLESACFNNTNDSKKGGDAGNMDKFEELLEKYNKTAEDVTFDYAELSDEELEAKFEEEFGDDAVTADDPEDNPDGENGDDGVTVVEDENGVDDGEGSEDPEDGEDESQTFENMTRTFEISHDDVRYALYKLLAPYEEADGTYYWISDVYDTYFVYEDWDNKIYRQGYTKDNETDTVAFDGERVELFKELLTASEKAELEALRANYAELKEFKENVEKNELHSKKEEIINSDRYAVLAEKNDSGEYVNTDFAELVNTMDDYSVEEFETKIKVMHSDYMSSHSNFSSIESDKKQTSVKLFANINKKSKPKKNYGNLFD
nr:MAG TPA: hypothetical protein [Caudoviricetes sp.]